MRISARCDYACKALLELSMHWPDETPLQIQQISEKQKIPLRYLVQILIQLKRQGLVTSYRGRNGGYNLAQSPELISLGEIMRSMGGPLLPVADSASKKKSIFLGVWQEVEREMTQTLDRVTFEDICNKVKGADKVIQYQI
jgi:Rrf2 family cysteine metabolism transcriptional repressor